MTRRAAGERGYAMAALLVAMSVMAVLMGALLPQWSTLAKREREEELIFRGKQYARAIGLFQRKFANAAPPTIDVLVEQHFLRKKYKDPITNDDFQPIFANQQMQPGGAGSQVAQRPGQQANTTLSTPAQQQLQSGFNNTGVGAQGGIIGVTSKSKDQSMKLYNGRDHYNEWAFIYLQTSQRPGQSVNIQNLPGQGRGGPGGQGGRGGPGTNTAPFGMQPGGFPGGRGGPGNQNGPFQGPPGFGQPNRPPVTSPGQFPGQFPQGGFPQNPNGTTPVQPGQPRRPGGQ